MAGLKENNKIFFIEFSSKLNRTNSVVVMIVRIEEIMVFRTEGEAGAAGQPNYDTNRVPGN